MVIKVKHPPLKWHGGKAYLASWIRSLAPKHTHYVEPFFGGGQVLFAHNGHGVSEVVNDLDFGLTNFWKVLQDPVLFEKFKRRIEATPISKLEWSEAARFDICLNEQATEPNLAMAVAFFILYRQSRQALGGSFATLSRSRTRQGMNEQASSWWGVVDGLEEAYKRLRRVVIYNEDFVGVIAREDSPDTWFYCDPPYMHETRTAKDAYAHEMSVHDHQRLLDRLSSIRGKFALSGYHSSLYDKTAAARRWRVHEKTIDNKASGAAVKERKVEVVWTNY